MATPDPPRVQTASPSHHAELASYALRFFDGYPYLVTRVVPRLYHVILLPAEVSPDGLRELARSQVQANRLSTCLVLGEDLGLYLTPEGGQTVSRNIPCGGILVADRLRPPAPIPLSAELAARRHLLQALLDEGLRNGTLFGDLTKGGRPATPEEQARLAGRNPSGVPRGMAECRTCGEWRGTCLDPSEQFAGHLMRVHCLCENWNRCARCGGYLYARRLNANYYNPADGRIWHVPGFCAFDHACKPKEGA
jgi:hypothetical protein